MEKYTTMDLLRIYDDFTKEELIDERKKMLTLERESENGKKKYDFLTFRIEHYERHQQERENMKESIQEIVSIISKGMK